ncbi:MAG: hypothetical protein J0L99_07835 [Chitinophagales bacterium]|jgi:hypothetical protein|nr:hypothetical protein [Chitinophagales bacterium]
MTALRIQQNEDSIQVTLDKKYFSEEEVLQVLNFLNIEILAKKADFQEDIEQLGEEVKQNWWIANKHRFIAE